MKRDHKHGSGNVINGGPEKPECSSQIQDPSNGEDELLAVLGYNVQISEMADVARKLEQLEMVMGSSEEDGISHLSSNTVHYNPSDLFSWVQSMLSELNTPPLLQSQRIDDPVLALAESSSNQSGVVFSDDSEYDLRAIPGVAAYPQNGSILNSRKRLKKSESELVSVSTSTSVSSEPSRSVVLVDSQETGVRLVHTLLGCAEAVQQNNLNLADALLKNIGLLAASQAGAMRKVATYFAEALARRIYKIQPQNSFDSSFTDLLQNHFYESCPYLKFAHFTANQAILEAFSTAARVHVIDFGLQQGLQWPALMQALALRPGGPPSFRLTGIGPPQVDDTDALQQVGWKLAQFADMIGVKFEFRGFYCNSLADLKPSMLDLRPADVETVAVNSVFELHRLLARSGAIEKVLSSIKAVKPKIVTVVEQVADHNGPLFLDRFTEALHYYSSFFDSLEGSSTGFEFEMPSQDDLMMSELYLGRQICNVVACEGPDRVERHETLNQWRARLGLAGFELVHLGSNAFKQASTLLALFAGRNGYKVDESNGCLMLGWHTRPLIATSAWAVSADESISAVSDSFDRR